MAKADTEQMILTDPLVNLRPSNYSLSRACFNSEALREVVLLLSGRSDPSRADPGRPAGVSPQLFEFVRVFQKRADPNAVENLWQFARRLVNSEVGREDEQILAYRFADWAVSEIAPLELEAQAQHVAAQRLRAQAPMVNRETATRAMLAVDQASRLITGSNSATASAYAAAFSANNSTAKGILASSAHAAEASFFAEAAGVDRKLLTRMRLNLLDQLCPTEL